MSSLAGAECMEPVITGVQCKEVIGRRHEKGQRRDHRGGREEWWGGGVPPGDSLAPSMFVKLLEKNRNSVYMVIKWGFVDLPICYCGEHKAIIRQYEYGPKVWEKSPEYRGARGH